VAQVRTVGVDVKVRGVFVNVHKWECTDRSLLLSETEIEFVSGYTIVTDCAYLVIGLHESNASVNVEIAGGNVVIFNEEDVEVVLEEVQGGVGVDSPASTLGNGVGEGNAWECTRYVIDVTVWGTVVCNMISDFARVNEVLLECGDSARDFRQAVVSNDANDDLEIGSCHR